MLRTLFLALAVLFFTACDSNNNSGTEPSAQDNAINKIVSFAQEGTEAPTVQDYIDAGVSGITEDNLNEINSVVAGLTSEDVDTLEEIQALANELNVEIVAENIPPIAKAGSPKTKVKTGETVEFSSRLSSDPDGEIVSYQWFENGVSVAKVPYFWKVYNVPGTYKMKLVVTDNDGATSSTQYEITVEASTVTYFENTTETPLVDAGGSLGSPIPMTTSIFVDAENAVTSISKMTVTINISHTWVGDLRISLKSPTGTSINLINRHGVPPLTFGTGDDDFTNTTFDDDAATPIEAGSPPFTGTFIPEEPLANFTGENATGTWTLSVEDNAPIDTGTFHSWSMTIE